MTNTDEETQEYIGMHSHSPLLSTPHTLALHGDP